MSRAISAAGSPAASGQTVHGVTHSALDFDMPRGACDCHVHVMGSPPRYAYAADRVYTPGVAEPEDLMMHQRVLGLDRVVLVQASPFGSDNSCMLDAMRRIGSAARAVAVIDARTSDDALRQMHAAGVRGVRVNLETYGQSDPALALRALQTTARRVAPLGWHVQIFTNLAVISALRNELQVLPTTLVFDHFGRAQAAKGPAQPGFDALLALVNGGKAYVKISAPHRLSSQPDFADVSPLARALIAVNADRILWGSDWPHTMGAPPGGRRDPHVVEPFRPIDDGSALNRLHRWTRDRAELEKILVHNPARLYDY
jgi:predicted TIM-barrel fold metal-dependent hydrolase